MTTAATANEQLGRKQQWVIVGLTVVIAATRFLALRRSMWVSDEALFAMALHRYDSAAGVPPFPGAPLFVAIGRLLRTFAIHDDFRALRTISLLASMSIFPAAFALGRALRLAFVTTLSSAILLAFLPNVWAFGGTALAGTLSLVLVMSASALLLVSFDATAARSGTRFSAGSALLALSLLVQPQNILCAYPWFVAAGARAKLRRGREVFGGALVLLTIVAAGYGVAAGATGVSRFASAAGRALHTAISVEGFGSPDRAPSLELFPRFVIDPCEAGKAAAVLFIFAVIGLFFAKRPEVDAVATFLPLLLFVLFTGPVDDAARLSIAFSPLVTLLAASGIERFATRAGILARLPRVAPLLELALVVALTVRFATWFAPALREARRTDSATVQAMRWVHGNVPRSATLLVDREIAAVAAYFLPGQSQRPVAGEVVLPALPPIHNSWYIGAGESREPVAATFAVPRGKLFAVFGRRGFEAFARPFTRGVRYLEGWYPAESDGKTSWRWMGRRARLELEPIPAGGELRLTAVFPIDHEPPPVVTVSIDGQQREQFTPASMTVARSWPVAPSPAAHRVDIEVSNVVNPLKQHFGDDARDLGMQLRTIWWQP